MSAPARPLPPHEPAARLIEDGRITARSAGATDVHVDVTLEAAGLDLPPGTADAIGARLSAELSAEFGALVSAYRARLEESLVKGQDAALREALNRARLQTRLLDGLPMADQAEACELLGLSLANPSATMKRKEQKGEILRFSVEGRARYPLFQFDVEARRIHPAMAAILSRRPDSWSDFRLLHWLTRPHAALDGATPAATLGHRPAEVLAAFGLAAERPDHG
ncbi:hypothetical protein [Mangrovicoccus sp. HB161399]|uniref:hypothetical protein n=1 Tax=Mangrovicoccus sp. HB161399 TaxID=2720392 RepID=UPI001553138F|nr:hypothetical protein [Mangrovicoccus sp. HB161399]